MGNLILFETKKFLKRKKNIITIVIFCLIIVAYIFANNSLERQKELSKAQSYKFEIESLQNSINQLEQEYKDKKLNNLPILIDKEKRRLDLIWESVRANSKNDWKTELKIQIKLDEELAEDITSGNVISGRNIDEVKSTIQKNKILYENNIKPIIEENTMSAFNFLRLACRDIIPMLVVIITLLLSADAVSIENDEGTFKFLLTQPISRIKVLFSKIISVSLNSLILLSISIFLFFILLGIIKGFGSPLYPTDYYTGNMTSFLFKDSNQFFIKLISISKFLIMIIPLNVLIVFFSSSFGILTSILIQNSTASICASVLIAVGINIFNIQLKFLKELSQFIPFTYSNSVNVLNGTMILQFGNKNITLLSGIIILISVTLLFYLISISVFKRRDVTC